MDGTLATLADAQQTAKENAATCYVLREQLEAANKKIVELQRSNNYWINQFKTTDNKLQEIKKVLK